jgi:hypothetical protein
VRPGRWSRSVRARAAGVGPACSRRHATRAGTDEAPARRRANKNPDRRKRAGLDETRYLRLCENPFREGNDPCFHRVDCPVGGSFCTASCFFVRTHSLPQETSAGRNLITLFHTVNTLAEFFFRPAWHPTRPVGAVGDTPRHVRFARRSPASPKCFYETALFKGFAKTETGACAIGGELARLRHADRNALRGRANAPCRKVHRGAPVSRRTSRFARKCANFSGARRPHRGIGRSSSASSTTHRWRSLGCFDSPCRRCRRGASGIPRCRFAGAPTCVRDVAASASAGTYRCLRITSSSLSELDGEAAADHVDHDCRSTTSQAFRLRGNDAWLRRRRLGRNHDAAPRNANRPHVAAGGGIGRDRTTACCSPPCGVARR